MAIIDAIDSQGTRCIYDDNLYRYWLEFNLTDVETDKTCLVIMHNPSNGKKRAGDMTLKRLENKLIYNIKKYNIFKIIICNLVPYVNKDKDELSKAFRNNEDIFGENDKFIINAIDKADIIIAAWGNADNYEFILNQVKHYKNMFNKNIYCFYKTSRNFPSHPLWRADEVILQEYTIP